MLGHGIANLSRMQLILVYFVQTAVTLVGKCHAATPHLGRAPA